ncbi:MAG: hypothetical protein KDC81_12170 [Flavobacteriaceae bacterium]|nr:hypothetical protein [Flavobacteriaceae bacterium]
MIKFFRKIRQQLLNENKFSKYLIYAIGEIVLVVIGILIALQINNWNENRKKEELETSTLMELKANLNTDIKDFKADMKVYNSAVNSIDIVIEFIDGNIPYHDSLNIHLGKITVQGVFAPNKATYENLKITGIKLISNDSLRAAISDLYEGRYYYVEKYLEAEYQFDHQKFGEFYLKEMKEYSFFKYAQPIDSSRLINNQEFRNLIMQRKSKIQGWFKTQYELNIKRANEIIEMINKEIEQ